ncbi:MAG: EAL domain-containing protein [Magnetospirillum sp.]|nr:EAL domain-containing protein [Magnetospirillum sp.]
MLITAVTLSLIGGALYGHQSYWSERERIETGLKHQSAIATEATRISFSGLEALLNTVGLDLVAKGAIDHPERGETHLSRIAKSPLNVVAYGLAKPDGQLVLISGRGTRSLPNLMADPRTAISFQRTLQSDHLELGRPYLMPTLGEWVIPVRMAIRGDDGQVKAVMTAGLKIDGDGTIWADASRSPQHNLTVIHQDGYVQYTSRKPEKIEHYSEIYSKILDSSIVDGMRNAPHSGISFVSTESSEKVLAVGASSAIAAFNKLDKYNLLLAISIPYEVYRKHIINAMLPAATGTVSLILLSFIFTFFIGWLQKRHDNKIAFLVRHDEVTGLPNQNMLIDHISQSMSIARRNNSTGALLNLETSGFTTIRQSWGLKAAEQAQRDIAERLTLLVREGDVLARNGNDCFALLLSATSQDEALSSISHRIQASFGAPLTIEDQDFRLPLCIGAATYPTDATTPEDLLKAATLASAHGRKLGVTGLVHFHPDMDISASRRVRLEAALRGAVERGEITVVYQPKIDAHSGLCDSVEALARWHSKEWGTVSPDEFIHIAEESDLIITLGRFVLRQAISDVKAFTSETGTVMNVAVNVSAKQFVVCDMLAEIKKALEEWDFPPERLTVEVTESIMMFDKAKIVERLRTIRNLGAKVSIDDFGTGYSSLSYIHQLPATELKIDRSFIMDISDDDHENYPLVNSIIALGKALGIHVVAEGVESAEHVRLLTRLGIGHMQGYFFSPPRPLRELGDTINKNWLPHPSLP